MSDTGSLLPTERHQQEPSTERERRVGLIRTWWRSRSALAGELAERGIDETGVDLTVDGEPPTSVEALAACLSTELGRLRGEINERDRDLVGALERVADSYDRVAEQLEDNHRLQRLLAEGMVRIERRLVALERGRASRDGASGQRVIGGTITPSVERAALGDDFLDTRVFAHRAPPETPSRYSPVVKPSPRP